MANVSLVIVSHSKQLGEGLVKLLRQLAPGVDIHEAAGLGDELGTDATAIMAALQQCPNTHDILVFFDLGSAAMNAEMALELVPPSVAERTRIVDAPLVEGAVAAAVAARSQLPLDDVMQQAETARIMQKRLG
ncbi:dihydroxyacetone kinase phosphoryl donor subunit DhaM [Alicyclobacillus hesperidum]|uniref:dihydroxyacetone kinase phosphoryl donor subunit DhaM n=1 Tax=Alicyclobacillus hesperidum TaxID=89784 RepID=UPI00058D8BE6|nr:dihydroxyacetone kinase phosphoryl donor subunit DhaM [Alicyclobacillus hesperidum]